MNHKKMFATALIFILISMAVWAGGAPEAEYPTKAITIVLKTK